MLVNTAASQRALTNLSGNPEFVIVCGWIEQTLADRMDDLLRASNTVSVHQLQGYCSALKDFLQAARPAQPPAARLG